MSGPGILLHTAETCREFVRSLREDSIESFRFEWPDLAGLSRGKTVPIDHVEACILNGLNLYGGTVTFDKSSTPILCDEISAAETNEYFEMY